MWRMSRYPPDENREKDAHAKSPERQKASKEVDTFSRYDHQRGRKHIPGRNRNRPYLLSMRRMYRNFSNESRENEAHANSRLKQRLTRPKNFFLRYDYQAAEANSRRLSKIHKESAPVKERFSVLTLRRIGEEIKFNYHNN